MPIIDSHCHAWNYWPYLPEVPDPDHHGSVETLLNQMDVNGVDSATIVCAQIHRNPNNNDYVAAAVRKYPDRLNQFADVDLVLVGHLPHARRRQASGTGGRTMADEGVHSVRRRRG